MITNNENNNKNQHQKTILMRWDARARTYTRIHTLTFFLSVQPTCEKIIINSHQFTHKTTMLSRIAWLCFLSFFLSFVFILFLNLFMSLFSICFFLFRICFDKHKKNIHRVNVRRYVRFRHTSLYFICSHIQHTCACAISFSWYNFMTISQSTQHVHVRIEFSKRRLCTFYSETGLNWTLGGKAGEGDCNLLLLMIL